MEETFEDLYHFLQSYPQEHIHSWLNEKWQGKDKQESLLRLFAGLNLVCKLKDFHICKGNFNLKFIQPHTSIKDVFYTSLNSPIKLKDKGDASDLTGIHRTNKQHILLTTSKNLQKTNINKLDIDKILTNFQQYQQHYVMTLCIAIKDVNEYNKMKERIEKTNKELKTLIDKGDTIVIDWDDLNEAFHNFQKIYKDLPLKSIINSTKIPLILKPHQELSVVKTLQLKKEGKDKVLWGHIPRSGKSYIIGGCIIEDCALRNPKQCNYLLITTAPNETIEQYLKVFDCLQLQEFNILYLNNKDIQPKLTDKNIIICSKQFLQSKVEKAKQINWLKKLQFEMRFIDESHNGGTTNLAQKVLQYYGNKAFTIQITATYLKPINSYQIPKDNWILWDLEDIRFCKTGNIKSLIEKHGAQAKSIFTQNINEYSKYPDLWLLTDELKPEVVQKVISKTRNNDYGWSLDACFLLKQGVKAEFQNETEALKVWHRIFGKTDEFGIPHPYYPDNVVFLKRIEKISKLSNPLVIMAFLPQNDINEISKATINLLKKYNVIPDYEVISINSKITTNPKQDIENACIKAKNSNKKGVLVLSGKQCSLGVSISNCDIVLLLNNNTSFDMIYQMMFRCMTERPEKKCGFVVDLNIHRVSNIIVDYALIANPKANENLKSAIQYILQERLITLNGDHWLPHLGNKTTELEALSKTIYDLSLSNTEEALENFLNRLRFRSILLNKDEQKVFQTMFNQAGGRATATTIKEEATKEEKIKDGVEKKKIEKEEQNTEKEKVNEYTTILRHIIPLVCLLTIHDEKTTSFIEMFNYLEKQPYLFNILIEQIKSWWNKEINENTIQYFIAIYKKYLQNDKEINQIIRTIKELFRKNINKSNELSNLIDKYLIPQELEKKANAEVSTPFKLRQEMLDVIPHTFWSNPSHKVLEPCSGKGGFLLDIITRFMDGLKPHFPDEKERYKHIVENCLYWCDINPTNIFICKLLLNPHNEYKLNYYEGSTLTLAFPQQFDAVIGNPPYNSSGNTGTGNTIWQDFTRKALNEWIIPNGYLLYVHPAGWRKPNTEKSKFYGLYNLMTKENQMLYLSIHGIKDGQKTFKCGTRYDWYLIEKKLKYKNTIINDEKNKLISIDMTEFTWLPNYDIDIIQKIVVKDREDKCPIIYHRSNYGSDRKYISKCKIIYSTSTYDIRKKYISKTKDGEYVYPIIHTIPRTGVRYLYSKYNDKGHFGVSKVIFGDNGLNDVIIDMNGEYGMSENSMAIQVDNMDEAINIKNALLCEKFKNFIKSCIIGNFRIDWRLFASFKKDFWKEFI